MMAGLDYTRLSLDEIGTALEDVTRQAHATFGGFDTQQLNWRPDLTQWSVGQCVQHLLTANVQIRRAAEGALDPTHVHTIWERLPILPRVAGRLLIRSQAPESPRKFTAPPAAQPASDVPADIVQRFGEHHRQDVVWVRALNDRDAARTIMTSPFVKFATYSLLDGLRLMVAHDHRHLEQARRVTQVTGFPGRRAGDRLSRGQT